jgi:hypothetical protein
MNIRRTILAAAIAATCTVAANADDRSKSSDPAPSGMSMEDSFRSMDRDKNGRISRMEAAPDSSLGQEFAKLDKDGDGNLDSSEYRMRGPKSISSSQSPESSSPNSEGASSKSNPDEQQSTRPQTDRPRS